MAASKNRSLEALRLNFTDTHLVATGGQTDVQVEKAVSRFSSISMTLPAVSTERCLWRSDVAQWQHPSIQRTSPGTVVSVFNAAGTLLTSGTADDGDYTLSLDGYTRCVYCHRR